MTPLGTLYLDTGVKVDAGAERTRLTKELEAVTKHIAGTARPGTLGAIRMLICLILAWVMYWTRLAEITVLPPRVMRSVSPSS